MKMGGYYPALQVQPPNINPIEIYARALGIQHLQQTVQGQNIQNQMLQEEQQDDSKLRSIFTSAASHPEWTHEDILNQAELHGVGPRTLVAIRQGLIQGEQALSTLGQEQLKVQSAVADKVQGYLSDVTTHPRSRNSRHNSKVRPGPLTSLPTRQASTQQCAR